MLEAHHVQHPVEDPFDIGLCLVYSDWCTVMLVSLRVLVVMDGFLEHSLMKGLFAELWAQFKVTKKG